MNQNGVALIAARQIGSLAIRITICCALFTVSLAVIALHASPAWALPPAGYGTGPAFCHQHGGGPYPATLHFDDVYACATYSGGYAPMGTTPFDQNGDESFQCVELSDRFLWAKYGRWAGPGSDGGILNGYNLVSWAGKAYHIPIGKPSPSNIPVAGDIVSFQPGNGYDAGVGHTAVVIGSNPANLQFTILSENWTGTEPGIEIIKIGSGSDAGLTQYKTDGGNFNGVWDSTNFLEMQDAPTFYIATQSTPTTPPNATVGKPYSFTLTTTGGNRNIPDRWSLVGGSLPNGLTLSSTGFITGTAPAQSRPLSFTVKVVNGTKTAEGKFSIWALDGPTPPLAITTPSTTTSPPNAIVGKPYRFDLQASGGTGTYTWSLVGGALPNGLSLSSTGIISGTASAQSKPPSFTVQSVSGPFTSKKIFTIWALGTGTAQSTGNLVINGNFSVPLVGAGSYTLISKGESIAGWHVVGKPGNVGVVSGSFQNAFTFDAVGGAQWLDLTGGSNTETGVAQNVPTSAGTRYTLQFSVGNVYDPSGIFGVRSTVAVLVNGALVITATNSKGHGTTTQIWETFSVSFTANSSSTTIEFLNKDPPGDTSNGLDNISLSSAGSPIRGRRLT